MNCSIIIPAAGIGQRMGGGEPKQYLELGGRPLIVHTLERFLAFPSVVIPVEAGRVSRFAEEILDAYGFPPSWQVVAGGETRHASVEQGLQRVPSSAEVVLVHDGVRPFVTAAQIDELLDAVKKNGAALLAVSMRDTIKRVNADEMVAATVDRSQLWQAQTPQGARYELLCRAFEAAARDRFLGTDEASLLERIGVPVAIVKGDERNRKITTPEDLVIAEALLEKSHA